MEHARPASSFATLTHARLRATQGDVAGAARILRAILDVRPNSGEARELLAEIEDRVGIVHKEPEEDRPETALSDGGSSAGVASLSRWLQRARRNRGERRVR